MDKEDRDEVRKRLGEQDLDTWERMLNATLDGREPGQAMAPAQPSSQTPAALELTVEQQPAALPSLHEIPEEHIRKLEPISAGGVVNPFIPHPAARDTVAFEAEVVAWQFPADPDDDEMTEALGFAFEPEHGPVSEFPTAALQNVRVKKVPTSPSRAAAAYQPTAAVATETALPGVETREADNWLRTGTGTAVLEAAAATDAIPILTPASAAKGGHGGASDSRMAAGKMKDKAAAALVQRIQQARSSPQTGAAPEPRAAVGRRKRKSIGLRKSYGPAPRQAADPTGPSRRHLSSKVILQWLRQSRASLLFTVIFILLVAILLDLGLAAGLTALAGSLFLSFCGLSWRGLALFQSASLFVLVGLQVFAHWGHYFP